MPILMVINEAKPVNTGVWETTLTPGEIRRIGGEAFNLGEVSVIGVKGGIDDSNPGELAFDPSEASVLNLGGNSRCIILDLGREKGANTSNQPQVPTTRFKTPLKSRKGGRGDGAFLAACKVYLEAPLVALAERLLSEIRRESPGEMVEGLARKWVNYPDNFFALTIQNRDQSFAVHVRGEPNNFQVQRIEIKPDRGTYSRFKFSDRSQLPEVMKVISQGRRK